MMNILEKLLKARKIIRETEIAKEGRNEYSKYDYFTPSQVSAIVHSACQEVKLLPVFSLEKDDNGHYGELRIYDCESDGILRTVMRTEMPQITATNAAQQMGGMNTYCSRYMLMTAFDITDNALDFDAHDNRDKPQAKAKAQAKPQAKRDIATEMRRCDNLAELGLIWESLNSAEQREFNELKENLKLTITKTANR